MHNRFDQFVKNVLREMFDPLGTSQRELEISTDAQRIDFFFTPAIPAGALSDDASQAATGNSRAPSLGAPPLFARMAVTPCVVEHYRNPPNVDALRDCLRKQLSWHHVCLNESARAARAPGSDPAHPSASAPAHPSPPVPTHLSPTQPPIPAPGPPSEPARQTAGDGHAPHPPPMTVLWTLSTGRPADVMAGFAFQRMEDWPTGMYTGPLPALPFRIVVLNELPEDRATLPLRLLGRGATLRRALREFAALPRDAWERQHIAPLLVRCFVELQEAKTNPVLTEEEKELLMTAQEFIENLEEKALQQGVQLGLQQGVQQGLQQGVQQGLQPILHQMTRKLGRPVSPEERAVLRRRFDTLGPDRLGDVVLDLPATALAAWLADPEAR